MNDPDLQSMKPVSPWFRLKFGAVRGLLWLVVRCTSLTGLYGLGRVFGTCEWLINYKRRKKFHQRMKHIFKNEYDPHRMRHVCRSYFMRARCDKFYYLIFDLLPKDKIIRRIHFADRARFDQNLQRGKGLYVALSHHGAQHVAALLMCFLGYRTAGVRDRHEGPLRRYIQQKYADRFSEVRAAKMFFADSFPRDLFRWFQEGGVLGSALDAEREREPHLKRAEVQFFGETRHFLTGTLQIALRCQSSIFQGFVVSKPNFHYELIATPLETGDEPSENEAEHLSRLMRQYAHNIEQYIRDYPDHVSKV